MPVNGTHLGQRHGDDAHHGNAVARNGVTSSTTTDRHAIPWQVPLLDLACTVARFKWLVVAALVVGIAAASAMFVSTPPFYRASAVAILLPREKPVIDASITNSTLETTADTARRGPSGMLMLPPNPDLYLELLSSRAVLESVAEQFRDRLGIADSGDRSDETVAAIRGMITIKGSEEGLLTVTVTANDPQLAADIANAMVAEAESASKTIERQLILQQAGYLQQAVDDASTAVIQAENAVRTFTERFRLIDPNLEGNEAMRLVREAIAAREATDATLAGLAQSRTDADPEVKRLRAELQVHDERLTRLRTAMGGDGIGTGIGALTVDYEGLSKELVFRRDLLATLTAQADIFRIRAEQPAGNIAVVRPAVPVTAPAGPSRKRIFGIGLLASLTIGVGLALMLNQARTVRHDPELAPRLGELRDLLPLPHRLRTGLHGRRAAAPPSTP